MKTLYLSDNKLIGSIPQELGNLHRLRRLTLDGNDLSGSIPSALGDLGNLTLLWLSNNNLTGSIPPELGKLHNLSQLHLNGNALTASIPIQLGELNLLHQLWLFDNPYLIGAFPRSVSRLASLTRLLYHGTELCMPTHDPDVAEWLERNFPSGLPGVTCRESEAKEILTALYNATGGPNWKNRTGWLTDQAIGDWYGVDYNDEYGLRSIILYDNGLTRTIPGELGGLQNLERLDLGGNDLTGSIPHELGQLTELEYLTLADNDLTGAIPRELGRLEKLKWLVLSNNGLSGSIPLHLADLSNLERLLLDNNMFTARTVTDELIGPIPPGLGDLAHLNTLRLDNNPELGDVLPFELTKLDLEWLSFEETLLCAPTITYPEFADWFEALPHKSGQECQPVRFAPPPIEDLVVTAETEVELKLPFATGFDGRFCL